MDNRNIEELKTKSARELDGLGYLDAENLKPAFGLYEIDAFENKPISELMGITGRSYHTLASYRSALVKNYFIEPLKTGGKNKGADKKELYRFIRNSDKPLTYEDISGEFNHSMRAISRNINDMKRENKYRYLFLAEFPKATGRGKILPTSELFGKLANDRRARIIHLKNEKQMNYLANEILCNIECANMTKGKRLAISRRVKKAKLPGYVKEKIFKKLKRIAYAQA